VKKKITQVIETAKTYHPRAELFMVSILPCNGEKNSRAEINQFIKSQTIRLHCIYIDIGREEAFVSGQKTSQQKWDCCVSSRVETCPRLNRSKF
jgi:hypothetical protein